MRYYLFTTQPELACEAATAGIDGLVVDWERRGKQQRQRGYDFEINTQGVREVRRLVRTTALPVLVRINPPGPRTADEIRRAVDAGASEIMLPMARRADEVGRFLEMVNGSARTVVQIETQDLVDDLAALGGLPWDAAYIGLNDLKISRSATGSIWKGVADGTVRAIFDALPGRAVGFGGITVADSGDPLPFRLLFAEMIRLGCAMSFLRRSFHRDIVGRSFAMEIRRIRDLEGELATRTAAGIARDRQAFADRLAEVCAEPPPNLDSPAVA
jgi:2-keto-3-deoxy-L-rhamnonate aldolase RhmA